MTVLLLVGAGHAHLYVVKRAAELAAAGYRVHLLAPRYFDYSGVASATAAGALARDAGRIDVRALVGDSGVELHEDVLASLDPSGSGKMTLLRVAAGRSHRSRATCCSTGRACWGCHRNGATSPSCSRSRTSSIT